MSIDAERMLGQLTDALALLEKNRKRLSADMDTDTEVNSVHVKLANDIAKSSVELSKEARSWAKTSREIGKKLSLHEQIDLVVAFIKKLSRADLDDLLAKIGAKRAG